MSAVARRELAAAVVLCLVGAFLVLVAAGNDWFETGVASAVLGDRQVGVPGAEVAPGARALGLVGLAGVVAVAATRRWGRVLVGVLLLLVGAGVVALVGVVLEDSAARVEASPAVRDAGGAGGAAALVTAWPYACLVGGLLLATAGLVIAARGRTWAGLSQKYDVPAARAEQPSDEAAGAKQERALWEALDRGEDPTAR